MTTGLGAKLIDLETDQGSVGRNDLDVTRGQCPQYRLHRTEVVIPTEVETLATVGLNARPTLAFPVCDDHRVAVGLGAVLSDPFDVIPEAFDVHPVDRGHRWPPLRKSFRESSAPTTKIRVAR